MRGAISGILLGLIALAGCARQPRATSGTAIAIAIGGDKAEFPSLSGCPPLPPISGFVGRSDAALLIEGLAPFRGTGSNLYYLQQLLTYAQQDNDPKIAEAVSEVLDDLVCLSLPVARTGGFNDSQDRSSIRKGPHDFQEAGLRGLDQVIWEAKRRGIRLILPLVNNWPDYGGLPAYAAWASKEDGLVHAHDDFFSDARMRQWWKDYVTMLSERVNTYTGIAYRDEPTILAWELANEFRCTTCRGTTRLIDTVAELADFLRRAMPNHLVADGGEGFDDDPGSYLGLTNSYPVRGEEGTSYSKLVTLDELDMVSYHLYPKSYGLESARDIEIWIQRHQAIATVYGKVAYLGECGYVAPDAERARGYDAWLGHLFEVNDGSLGLMWQLVPRARLSNDEFAVYSRRDQATAWILSRWGTWLR